MTRQQSDGRPDEGRHEQFDNETLAMRLRLLADAVESTRYPTTASLLLVDWTTRKLAQDAVCDPIRVENYELDAARHIIRCGDRETRVGYREATMLYVTMCNPDEAVPDNMLAKALYLIPDAQGTHLVELRNVARTTAHALKSVSPDSSCPLHKVSDVGYRFETSIMP